MTRQKRKLEHIKYSIETEDVDLADGFSEIHLVHYAVSGIKPSQIDLSVDFLGKKLEAPIMINAITGGHPETLEINRLLAMAARKTGIAMAVGSQKAALENEKVRETFSVAREEISDGVLLANLSASCDLGEAVEAVKMIEADGIQLHLNVPQELFMEEGEMDFCKVLPNLKRITEGLHMPVIAKEVGFGTSRETVLDLYRAGVRMIDVGGRGGTNFISIENARGALKNKEFQDWGIPTAVCLFEGLELGLPLEFIASGGLRTSHDIVKSLAAGAKIAAIAGPFLKRLIQGSFQELVDYINELKQGLARIMVMIGAASIQDLNRVPMVISGNTAEWLIRRGVDINAYARRHF